MMRPDSPEWITAKAQGDRAEVAVAKWFHDRGYATFKTLGRVDFDLLLQCAVEVKHDLKAAETGNAAIEVAYRDKPSGILTTGASWWAIVVRDEAILVKASRLADIVLQRRYPERQGGDGGRATVQLVPLDKLRKSRETFVIPLPDLAT